MKALALFFLYSLVTGCVSAAPGPATTPPGMPLDPQLVPNVEGTAITRLHPSY